MNGAQAYVLVGPTATGKTEIAHRLALQLNAALLCADSMTVYRRMDIGTAKPTAAQRAEAPYFGLDIAAPDEDFSVAAFLDEARRALAAHRPLIVVGGSGLYVRCLIEGLRENAPADAALRQEAEALLAAGGVTSLQAVVRREAPAQFAALSDPANPRRLVRAWESARAGFQVPKRAETGGPVLAGASCPPPVLRARIAERVRRMYAGGLLEEAQALRRDFPAWSSTARHAIGYAEALTVADGRCTVAQAMEFTQRRTWQLARRQLTWFRHQARVSWVDTAAIAEPAAQAEAVMRIWETNGPAALHI